MAAGAGLANANIDDLNVNLPFASGLGGGGPRSSFKQDQAFDYSTRTNIFDASGGNINFAPGQQLNTILIIIAFVLLAGLGLKFLAGIFK